MKCHPHVGVLLVALALAIPVSRAAGQDSEPRVEVEVSTRQTFVGVPIIVSIIIHNTRDFVLPETLSVPGAHVRVDPRPTSNSMAQIIGGRRISSYSETHRFTITPALAGTITIPGFTVMLDGASVRHEPVEVLVNEIGADTNVNGVDRILLDVVARRTTFFLGEPVDVTLRIWILAYRDQQFGVTAGRSDMWNQMIKFGISEWGEFRNALAELQSRGFPGMRLDNRSLPLGGETLRTGADGTRRAYYFYDLPATIWPKQAGQLRLDDLRVLMEYPTRLRRQTRDPFRRGGYTVDDSDLVAAVVEGTSIIIKAPPVADRPDSFTGAIGSFSIHAEAQPDAVAVGDPITIAIDIRDRTEGGSRLDVLQPPRLDATGELVENFRFTNDPLAGEVIGRAKRFVQTIRATNDQVTRIPPIQFSFFDPVREAYVTVESDPIPLSVHAGSILNLGDVIESPGGAPAAPSGPTQLTEVSGGVLANYTGADLLLQSQTFAFGWPQAGLLAAPPFMVGVVALARRRRERWRTDHGYARRRGARRLAQHRLAEATSDTPDRIELVAMAVCGYVADRCNLPAGVTTRGEVIEQLIARNTPQDQVDSLDDLLAACEHARYAGGTSDEAETLTQHADQLINELERVNLG